MHVVRSWRGVLATAALTALACSPATEPTRDGDASSVARGAGGSLETIASGLDNPRGLSFAPNGALYVAEAGTGGDGPCFEGPEGKTCYGLSGSITRIWHGRQERVATGLPSLAATDGSGAGGPHGVALRGGNVHVTLGLGANPVILEEGGILGGLETTLGRLVAVAGRGPIRDIANVAGHEAATNPDGGAIDSNPFGITRWEGRDVVADAGGNSVVEVHPGGEIRTLATFGDRMVLAPPELGLPEGTEIPMQSVPTAVTVGPDGALYVGELTGFPFAVGAARVHRIDPTGTVEVYAEGLTNVIGIAFARDGDLLALEIATNSLFSGDPTGALVRMVDGQREVIVSDGLFLPGGLAVGPDGAAYVSNCGVCPGGGTVERISLD